MNCESLALWSSSSDGGCLGACAFQPLMSVIASTSEEVRLLLLSRCGEVLAGAALCVGEISFPLCPLEIANKAAATLFGVTSQSHLASSFVSSAAFARKAL